MAPTITPMMPTNAPVAIPAAAPIKMTMQSTTIVELRFAALKRGRLCIELSTQGVGLCLDALGGIDVVEAQLFIAVGLQHRDAVDDDQNCQ